MADYYSIGALEYTAPPLTPPDPPTDITFSSILCSGFTVGWTDNSSDETGFLVYVSSSGQLPTHSYSGGIGAVSQAVTDLLPETLYNVWVTAVSEEGESVAASGSQYTTYTPFYGNFGDWVNNGKQVSFATSGVPNYESNMIGKIAFNSASGLLYFGSNTTWSNIPYSENLPVYEDNTAASAGGVAGGAFYKTSDGTVMVRY